MSAPNAELAYRVTFTRIGRNHSVAPLDVSAVDGPNHLAKLIFDYARPHLGSRDVDVVLEEDMRSGWIFVGGFRTAGTFMIEAVPEIDTSTWHACAHRADFASAAEHDRDCLIHSLDADAMALEFLNAVFGPTVDVDSDGAVAVIVDHGPVRPPFNSGWTVYGTGCHCDWLGTGTPEHAPSPLCISLRPDADRDGGAQ
jgi:hypothetical protein